MPDTMYKVARSFKYVVVGLCLGLVVSMKSFGGGGPVQVEGVVTKDAAWSGEVLVVGDVLVPEGVTLTVAPGTKVMFAASESSKIEPIFLSMQTELMVRGVLRAEGTKDRPVTFMPAPEEMNTKKPARGDWGGIIFDGPGSGKSSLSFARLTMAETAISTYGSSPAISDCSVTDCKYGLVCMGDSRPKLTRCVITDGEFGVVASHGGRPEMDGTLVEKNEHDLLMRD
jgi:hypothetical protein